MSRSRRKTPVFGNTTSGSDKPYKRQENKAKRRAVRVAVSTEREPPPEKAFGNPWGGPKDGKHYWKRATKKDMAK